MQGFRARILTLHLLVELFEFHSNRLDDCAEIRIVTASGAQMRDQPPKGRSAETASGLLVPDEWCRDLHKHGKEPTSTIEIRVVALGIFVE